MAFQLADVKGFTGPCTIVFATRGKGSHASYEQDEQATCFYSFHVVAVFIIRMLFGNCSGALRYCFGARCHLPASSVGPRSHRSATRWHGVQSKVAWSPEQAPNKVPTNRQGDPSLNRYGDE